MDNINLLAEEEATCGIPLPKSVFDVRIISVDHK